MDTRKRDLILAALALSSKRKHKKLADEVIECWDTATKVRRGQYYVTALAVARSMEQRHPTKEGKVAAHLLIRELYPL